MITLRNTQRRIPLDSDAVRDIAQKILTALKYDDYDLGILITTNATIRRYNAQYRGKDKATDILSFPYHPDLKPGQRIKPASDDDKSLGDLILSPEYILKDAPRFDMTFEERIPVLLVHGICHLLGYDHIEDADYAVMNRMEKKLLKLIGESR